MIKLIVSALILSISLTSISYSYDGSTTAAVVISGGIIQSKHNQSVDKKYKRKDCPVCKGKGWYMSGDKLKKIECQYCEPDEGQQTPTPENQFHRSPRIIRR